MAALLALPFDWIVATASLLWTFDLKTWTAPHGLVWPTCRGWRTGSFWLGISRDILVNCPPDHRNRAPPDSSTPDTQRDLDGMETVMDHFLMASVTLLLGTAIAVSGWRTIVPTIEHAVPDDDALAAADEAHLSLLLICW
jgi:hypothetical protein